MRTHFMVLALVVFAVVIAVGASACMPTIVGRPIPSPDSCRNPPCPGPPASPQPPDPGSDGSCALVTSDGLSSSRCHQNN